MIENELRIDNLVLDSTGNTHRVEGVFPNRDYSDWSGIPLTEERLLNFGFCDEEYKPGYIGIDYKANFIIDFVLTKPKVMGEWQEYFVWEHVKNMYTKLEFVHQLQNLFYSITGQELKIKS